MAFWSIGWCCCFSYYIRAYKIFAVILLIRKLNVSTKTRSLNVYVIIKFQRHKRCNNSLNLNQKLNLFMHGAFWQSSVGVFTQNVWKNAIKLVAIQNIYKCIHDIHFVYRRCMFLYHIMSSVFHFNSLHFSSFLYNAEIVWHHCNLTAFIKMHIRALCSMLCDALIYFAVHWFFLVILVDMDSLCKVQHTRQKLHTVHLFL